MLTVSLELASFPDGAASDDVTTPVINIVT